MSLSVQRYQQFVTYSTISAGTLSLDVVVLLLLVRGTTLHYILAAGCSFTLAALAHYYLVRRHVFAATVRGVHAGFAIYLGIECLSLMLVMAGIYVLVGHFGLPMTTARVLLAGGTGVWSYLMNTHVNFYPPAVSTA